MKIVKKIVSVIKLLFRDEIQVYELDPENMEKFEDGSVKIPFKERH